MKLALGTVQFGLDYGISNKTGKLAKDSAFDILELACTKGIDTIDTAFDYGDSEAVIGEFIKQNNAKLNVVSKFPKCKPSELEGFLDKSLKRLNLQSLYGYLIHSFGSFQENSSLLDKLQDFKQEGKVEKIGFSLYYPKEAEYILEKGIEVDLLQLPFSVFDQRFSPLLKELKERGIEIHARSVFLQGLAFKEPADLFKSFGKVKGKLSELKNISEETGVSVSSLCINFVALNEYVDRVVVGVDSLQNLEENIKAVFDQGRVKAVYEKLLGLKEDDESIVLPFNWKKGDWK